MRVAILSVLLATLILVLELLAPGLISRVRDGEDGAMTQLIFGSIGAVLLVFIVVAYIVVELIRIAEEQDREGD